MPLSWKHLAETDDFLSGNLIDNAFFWIETRKVRITESNDPLKISEVVIIKLLRKYLIALPKPNVTKCVNKFMNHQITRNFLQRFEDHQSILDFKKHTRKYFELYLPECGFELGSTDRYKSKSGAQEACVIARKVYDAEDEIEFLQGTFAELDSDGEEQLDKNDFSVFNTTSNSNSKLMLGPCRFVNHNCHANCKFLPTSNGVKVIAIKRILPGEEITVAYSPSYFGKNNKHCLCAYCEANDKGAYDPNKEVIPDSAVLIDVSSSEDEDDAEEKAETDAEAEAEADAEPEIIVIEDTDAEAEDDELGNREDEVSDSDFDELARLDPRDFIASKTDQSIQDKNLRNLRHPSDEPFEEPESEVVGGRRLRPRLMIKPSTFSPTKYSILMHYPLDNSFDSLMLESRGYGSDHMKRRQIQRTLHKLYMTQVYKHDTFRGIFDCRHCGVYFEREPLHPYREYCPRCTRHQKIFGFAWPFTRDYEGAASLILDASVFRYDIRELLSRKLNGTSGRVSNIRHKSHGGIAMPVVKNPRDLKNPISLKRFRHSEESRSSLDDPSDDSTNSGAIFPIVANTELDPSLLTKGTQEFLKRPKLTDRPDSKHRASTVKNKEESSLGVKAAPGQSNNIHKKLEGDKYKNEFTRSLMVNTNSSRTVPVDEANEDPRAPPTISEILSSKPKVNPEELARSAKERLFRQRFGPEELSKKSEQPHQKHRWPPSHVKPKQSYSSPQQAIVSEKKSPGPYTDPLSGIATAQDTVSSKGIAVQNPKLGFDDVGIINVLSALDEKLFAIKKIREFKVPESAEVIVLDSD